MLIVMMLILSIAVSTVAAAPQERTVQHLVYNTATESHGKEVAPVDIEAELIPGQWTTVVQFALTPMGDAQVVQVNCYVTDARERDELPVTKLDTEQEAYMLTVRSPFDDNVPQWLVISAQVEAGDRLLTRVLSMPLNNATRHPQDQSTIRIDARGNRVKETRGVIQKGR